MSALQSLLQSLSFLKYWLISDLRAGGVARQVGKSSGCSIQSLWGTPVPEQSQSLSKPKKGHDNLAQCAGEVGADFNHLLC